MTLSNPRLDLGMRAALAALFAVAWLAISPVAQAQIKEPGRHARYTLDLEPHLVLAWDHGPARYADEGFGLGLRATIPFFHNGPIAKINNNMGISFGVDFAHYSADEDRFCRDFGPDYCRRWDDYDADVFWFPVAMQWNFFFHPNVVVFGEAGIAFSHERYRFTRPCGPAMDRGLCDYSGSDTDFFDFVFAAGGRFMVSDSVGIVVRLGLPAITVGASFLL
jgi:hypothetical protein